ncbi:MAG: ATP-binding protein [Myxococcota bacterium]
MIDASPENASLSERIAVFAADLDEDSRRSLEALAAEVREVESERQFFRQIVERVREAIIVTDADIDRPGPRIQFVNQGFSDLTGYRAEEAIGGSPRILQGPRTDRKTLAALRMALEERRPFTTELENYYRDGRTYWIEFSVAPMVCGGRDYFVAIERDVTQRKRMEEELQAAKARAEHENALRKQVLRGLSSDFRRPVHNMLGLVEAVEGGFDPSGETFRLLRASAEELHQLVEDLLLLHQASPSNEPTAAPDIADVCAEAMARVRHEATLAGVQLRFVGPRDPQAVFADRGLLADAVGRVLENAVRASRTSQEVCLRCEVEAGRVRLIVEDDGPGIDPTELPHVFEDFYQGQLANPKGHGLGLGICREIVERCGGEVSIRAERDTGTAVVITIPTAAD